MAHWQLGDQETSLSCYQRASEWSVKNQLGDGQLRNHLAAAARLLKVEEARTQTRTSDSEKYDIPILRKDEKR
jgi:hypothetical protein